MLHDAMTVYQDYQSVLMRFIQSEVVLMNGMLFPQNVPHITDLNHRERKRKRMDGGAYSSCLCVRRLRTERRSDPDAPQEARLQTSGQPDPDLVTSF